MPLAERRERLIDAAIAVIADRGVHAATTRAIVAEAGMPLASFHYAFDSHASLMRAAMTRVLHEQGDRLGAITVKQDTLGEAVGAALLEYLAELERDHGGLFAVQELTVYALRTPGQEALADEAQAVSRQVARRLLEDFCAAQGCTFTQPIESIAAMLIALTDGMTHAYAVTHDVSGYRATIPAIARGFDSFVQPGKASVHVSHDEHIPA